MANIKNIIKKLVNNGYSEDELMMMTEKEIREAYKVFKKEKEEITMNNNVTVETAKKEEFIMIKEMKKLAKSYDCFTHCIDDYSQQKEAESHNHELAVKFVEVANKMGINATKDDLYEIASNDSIDEAIKRYIKSHEVRVVSTTLTEQNGELTFVELSPEQKLEISAVLNAQLQDVNYSSWFEEENGIFKLYGGWVDEEDVLEDEYSFSGNKLIKIERGGFVMENNTTANGNTTVTKEEVAMENTATVTTNNDTAEAKEEMTMETLIRRLTENKKIQDKDYIKKDDLRIILNEQFGFNFNNKSTRTEMVEVLMNKYKDSLKIVDDNNIEDNSISVGDFCRDNAPESIEEPPVFALDSNIAAKILEKVIRQADTNKAKNFISNWMLTSAISEVLFGVPLKEKRNGEIIEYCKGFSKEQYKVLAYIHKEFVNKSGFVAKRKDGTIVGYTIPAKVLVWGRHKYLNKACTYKVVGKDGKPLAEYKVSMNGIKDAATGKMIPLTADDYDTLDTKCVFIR